jgi:undecaprenyl-diphosphatase
VNELDFVKAIVLGVIQGATEFLPVSSSGHLAITQHLFGLTADSPQMLLFDVLAHLGTLIAVLLVFVVQIRKYVFRLAAESRPSWRNRRYAWRIALLGVAACIPTAVIGFVFKDSFEDAFESRILIGVCLLVTGLLLAGTKMSARARRGWKDFSGWRAALVGVAQALAILPGISRSGATICVASSLGLRRRWAGEFSFFIAVPAICGAVLLKIKDTFELPADEMAQIPWAPVIAGSLVSLVVGAVALKILLDVVRRAKLHYFAIYCWIVGAALLIWNALP